jgi:excisionase family DNA binding protein
MLSREFITREEFAARMHYSVRTVDEIIAKGEIDVHRYGRNVRIPLGAYQKFKLGRILLARNGAARFLPEQAEEIRELLRPVVRDLVSETVPGPQSGVHS